MKALALSALAVLLLPLAQAEPSLHPVAGPSALTLADAAWRSDGALALAVGGQPGQGVAVLVQDGEASLAWQGAHRLLAVAWHPSEPWALVAGDGALLRTDGRAFTDVPLPAEVVPFDGRSISWKPDGSEALVSGSALLRYVAATGSVEVVRQAADESFGAVAWGPRGDVALVEQAQRAQGAWRLGRLLTFDGTGLTHVADAGSGNTLVARIAWSPDGSFALLATSEPGTGQGPVLRWEQGVQPAFTPPAGLVQAIAWRGDEALLAGAAGLGLAQTDGTRFDALRGVAQDVLAAAWQPGGDQALLAGQGGALWLWSPQGLPQARIEAPLAGALVRTPVHVAVSAAARDGDALQGVDWQVDGGPWQGLALDGAAWRATWDAAHAAEGMHTLRARARDAHGPGPAMRVDVRVVHQQVPPALRGDVQGTLAQLAWTDTGGPMYELQDALLPDFGDAQLLARTAQPAATLALGDGEHHVRVRAVGPGAGPWSEPLLLHVASPRAAPAASVPALPPAAPERAPFPAPVLAFLAAAGAALLARRR